MGEKKIINFEEKRKKAIETRRREFERVVFSNFLGCYGVIDENGGLMPIELVDISENGCLLQLPWNKNPDGIFKDGRELILRLYFTNDSYLPVTVNIKYHKEHSDKDGVNYIRYGCKFDKTSVSFAALEAFINFINRFAEFSGHDRKARSGGRGL